MRHHRSTLAVLAGAALLSGCAVRPAPRPVEPAPVVEEAPVGPGPGLVRAVQLELIRTGYFGGRADGVLGPRTGAAISRFESANGLPVDGAPSWRLLRRLRATASAGGGRWVNPAKPREAAPAPEVGPAPEAAPPPANSWVAPSGPAPGPAVPPPPAGGNQ